MPQDQQNPPVSDPRDVSAENAEGESTEVPDDDERTVRRLLEGASNPIGDVERGAAGLKHKHLHEGEAEDFVDPAHES